MKRVGDHIYRRMSRVLWMMLSTTVITGASVRAQGILPASGRLVPVAGSPGQEPFSAAVFSNRQFLYNPLLFPLPALGHSRIFPQPRTDQAPAGLQRLDERILEYLADHRTPEQTKVWRFISNSNTYVDIGIPAGVLLAGIIRNDYDTRQNALYIASSTAVTFLVNYGLKKIFRRPRPFITDLHLTPVYRPDEYSFPSGHAQSSFATVTAFSRAYPKWYVIAPSLLWAASVGYSRMYLGVHYPSDVTAGALLGAGTAFGMGFLRP